LFLVTPLITAVSSATGVEGQSAELECVSLGDPAPFMSFRRVGDTKDYPLGSSVSNYLLLG